MKQDLVEILDANFREHLKGEFPNAFIGDFMDANHTDIVNCKEINICYCYPKIESLEGIEHFINIEYLFCSLNDLTSLDISKNLALTSLDCQYNNLISLDVTKNVALEYINCKDNKLSSLDLSKNLKLNSNKIKCNEKVIVTFC